jgi:hypothetical protein
VTRPRLAIGPANYAGQAHAWAEAVNDHLDADATAFTVETLRGGGFSFPAHRRIPRVSYYLPLARNVRARHFLRTATHVILDGFRTVYYDRRPDGFTRQAAYLRDHGLTVGLLAHGTDIRDPDAHAARHPHSYFAECDPAWVAQRRRSAARNREAARALGVPLFVSTPDLLLDLPDATWVPVCVDPERWAAARHPLERPVPKVLFVPSQRNPPIKGTRHADPVLRRLADRGLITYLAPVGVPHEEMVALVRDADVVVDQLQSGFYGVAAVEALAAGRVVVGSIDGLEHVMPELPPLAHATPDDFETVLLRVLSDRDEARSLAAQGPGFVRHWHDGRESAARLAPFLCLPAT